MSWSNIQNAGQEPHAEAGMCGISAMKRPWLKDCFDVTRTEARPPCGLEGISNCYCKKERVVGILTWRCLSPRPFEFDCRLYWSVLDSMLNLLIGRIQIHESDQAQWRSQTRQRNCLQCNYFSTDILHVCRVYECVCDHENVHAWKLS